MLALRSVAMDGVGECKLEDFRRVRLEGDIEISMHINGNLALVAWPWWEDPEKIDEVTWITEMMGFEDMLEVGSMQGYSIPEVDCDDWDYMLVGVRNEPLSAA